jgi:hypothetical protein
LDEDEPLRDAVVLDDEELEDFDLLLEEPDERDELALEREEFDEREELAEERCDDGRRSMTVPFSVSTFTFCRLYPRS